MHVRGAPTWSRWRHAGPPTEAFGRAPCGHETCERCAEMGAVVPCGSPHGGRRWSSLWGHETSEGTVRTVPLGH
eukprot:1481745-Pyramimonas_sp.AAC.1